ncbi:MAG TPA: hypothetical protein VF179_03605 [Thermoanaerobaculia bacterium]|nr:hypothetical protein [Thermoanaerobaculia bacterium]
MKTTTYRVWGLIALLVLVSPLAVFAQKSARAQGPYHDVEIQVKDLSSDQVIGTIQPGGTFTLTEGQRVRLIMTAIHPGQGKGVYYPETQFSETEPGRGWVRVTRTSAENSSATLETVRPSRSDRNRTETLRYQITENIGIPNNLRQGTVTIRVEPVSASSGSGPSYTSGGTARGLTNMLYRGILMRDFDPSGQPYVDRIASGGYNELIKIADEIARSEESRFQVYTRGERVTQEQRLLALYQNLLNMNSNQVDREQWSYDLRRLEEGKVADVVRDMVRSDRFQDVHDVSSERTAIRY